MEYMIAGTVIGLCLFILPLWAYRRGLKDGLDLQQGKHIEPIQNPVQAITSHVEKQHEKKQSKEKDDLFAQGLQNLLAYDGTPQRKEDET